MPSPFRTNNCVRCRTAEVSYGLYAHGGFCCAVAFCSFEGSGCLDVFLHPTHVPKTNQSSGRSALCQRNCWIGRHGHLFWLARPKTGHVSRDVARTRKWESDGLEHVLFSIIYWECHHSNWRTHIFQRGRYTTNQVLYGLWICDINGLHSTYVWLVTNDGWDGWLDHQAVTVSNLTGWVVESLSLLRKKHRNINGISTVQITDLVFAKRLD